jgi:hypothetical protein
MLLLLCYLASWETAPLLGASPSMLAVFLLAPVESSPHVFSLVLKAPRSVPSVEWLDLCC